MDKRIFILLLLLLSMVANAGWPCYSRWAFQGAIATGGNLDLGIVNYTEYTEIGLTASALVNNAACNTEVIVPVLFAGLRKNICHCTYFAFGIDTVSKFGKENGCKIRSDYQIGPYVSLEQQLTDHLLLVGWILPYSYQYEEKCCWSLSTNRFFASGGIGLSYLF